MLSCYRTCKISTNFASLWSNIEDSQHMSLVLNASTSSECSDESVHTRSLTRAFASRIHKRQKRLRLNFRIPVPLGTSVWALKREFCAYMIFVHT